MMRITPVEGRRTPLLVRLLNLAARRMLGQELTPLKVIAHNPGFILPYAAMSRFVRAKSELPSEVRALAIQLVAVLNGCAWCIDFGRREGQARGIPAGKLAAVASYATDRRFSPAERAALAFAEEATQVGARVSDETFAGLRHHFSERAIVELTVAVAAENFFNRINAPLGIEAQGFCAVPWLAAADVGAA